MQNTKGERSSAKLGAALSPNSSRMLDESEELQQTITTDNVTTNHMLSILLNIIRSNPVNLRL